MHIVAMKFTKRTLLIVVLIATSFTMVFTAGQHPAKAQSDACATYSNLVGAGNIFAPGDNFGRIGVFEAGEVITVSATVITPGTASFHIYTGFSTLVGPTSAPGTLTYTVPFTGWQPIGFQNLPTSTADISFTVSCASVGAGTGTGPARFTDGRLNDMDYGQSAAVYCEDGGITIYGFSGKWGSYLAFKVSKAQLATYPATPVHNTLITQKFGVRLYKLTSGEYQINASTDEPGKEYSFRWTKC